MTTPVIPSITAALRAEASRNPGGWVYSIGPQFTADGEVPPAGVMGAWQIESAGHLGDDFRHNPKYIPSPVARGWRRPRSELEFVVQQVSCGYLPASALRAAFLEADVTVFAREDGDESLHVSRNDGEPPAVFAFSDDDLARASGWPRVRTLSGAALLALLPDDAVVVINSGSECVANFSRDGETASAAS